MVIWNKKHFTVVAVGAMLSEKLLSIENLLINSCIVILISVSIGLIRPKWCLWRHVDLPYYLLGFIGLFSFFAEKSDIRAERIRLSEVDALTRVYESRIPDDPRGSISANEMNDLFRQHIGSIERKIENGCKEYGYVYYCFQIEQLNNIGYTKSQDTIFDIDIEDIHIKICDQFNEKLEIFRTTDLRALECYDYHRGNYYDSEYLRDKMRDFCPMETMTTNVVDGYEPGTILHETYNNSDRGGRQDSNDEFQVICQNIQQHDLMKSYASREIGSVLESYNNASHDHLKGPLSRILLSGWFSAFWPYAFALALALKLGKWASSVR